jgi:putative transcriptional regulator
MIINYIKKNREGKNITQEQLAQVIGVSRQTIIAMEKGNYEPSLGLALELSRYFKTNVEELFKLT